MKKIKIIEIKQDAYFGIEWVKIEIGEFYVPNGNQRK